MDSGDFYIGEAPPVLPFGDQVFKLNDYGSYTLKTTATHNIDLVLMITNWRIVMTPKDFVYVWDHGWCYSGHSLLVPVAAAFAWDPDTEAEPLGFVKRACVCPRRIL
jgi:hypothetical protein